MRLNAIGFGYIALQGVKQAINRHSRERERKRLMRMVYLAHIISVVMTMEVVTLAALTCHRYAPGWLGSGLLVISAFAIGYYMMQVVDWCVGNACMKRISELKREEASEEIADRRKFLKMIEMLSAMERNRVVRK